MWCLVEKKLSLSFSLADALKTIIKTNGYTYSDYIKGYLRTSVTSECCSCAEQIHFVHYKFKIIDGNVCLWQIRD